MTVNYALIVLTTQLDALSTLRSSLNKVTKISVLPADIFPNSPTLLILSRRPRELSKLYALSTRLKILAAMISDVRIFMRLWGLLGIWQWGVDTMRNPPDDKILRQITYLQVISNVFYQVLENGAYLAQHKVLPFDAKKQTQMWLWSSRFWAAHVGLEFWRLARDKQLRSSGEEKAWYDIAEEQKNSLWWKQLYVNLAYAPLTVRHTNISVRQIY